MIYRAVINSSFWRELTDNYENETRSRRYKTYNDHWHNDFLKYVCEILDVDEVTKAGIVTITNKDKIILFKIKYGDKVGAETIRQKS